MKPSSISPTTETLLRPSSLRSLPSSPPGSNWWSLSESIYWWERTFLNLPNRKANTMFDLSYTTYVVMWCGRMSHCHWKLEALSCFSLSYPAPHKVIFVKKELNHQWPPNQGCMAGKEQSVIVSWLAWRGSDTTSSSNKDVLGLCWTQTGDCWGFDRLFLFCFFDWTKLWVWDNNVIAERQPEFKSY